MRIIELKRFFYQIFALIERDVRFELRFKYNLLISYISPIIGILFPIIILDRFFSFNADFGVWNADNFLVYQFIAFEIGLIKGLIGFYSGILRREKVYTTLKLVAISPCNNVTLIFSIFLTHIVFISVPFLVIFIICYIYFPIKFISLIFFLLIMFLLSFVFSAIGIILAIISIIHYKYMKVINYLVSLIFMFSCISYPFEMFPEIIQNIVNLNPFYYMFNLLRSAWIDDNIILTINKNLVSFLTILMMAILSILTSIYIFNKYYKKYGVTERA